jgi:hypothetical protein
MQGPGQLLGQGGIDRALPLNPAHAREGRRFDEHVEMAFAALARPGMPRVAARVVDDLQNLAVSFWRMASYMAPMDPIFNS